MVTCGAWLCLSQGAQAAKHFQVLSREAQDTTHPPLPPNTHTNTHHPLPLHHHIITRWVEDGDLWRWSLPLSKSFHAGLGGLTLDYHAVNNPAIWQQLMELDVQEVLDKVRSWGGGGGAQEGAAECQKSFWCCFLHSLPFRVIPDQNWNHASILVGSSITSSATSSVSLHPFHSYQCSVAQLRLCRPLSSKQQQRETRSVAAAIRPSETASV